MVFKGVIKLCRVFRQSKTEGILDVQLFNIIISIGLAIIESIIGLDKVLSGIYSLGVLLPSLAVAFRRLHDTGRSAWWLLIGLIPLIGSIILLVFTCQDSQDNENKYGPNPKGLSY